MPNRDLTDDELRYMVLTGKLKLETANRVREKQRAVKAQLEQPRFDPPRRDDPYMASAMGSAIGQGPQAPTAPTPAPAPAPMPAAAPAPPPSPGPGPGRTSPQAQLGMPEFDAPKRDDPYMEAAMRSALAGGP